MIVCRWLSWALGIMPGNALHMTSSLVLSAQLVPQRLLRREEVSSEEMEQPIFPGPVTSTLFETSPAPTPWILALGWNLIGDRFRCSLGWAGYTFYPVAIETERIAQGCAETGVIARGEAGHITGNPTVLAFLFSRIVIAMEWAMRQPSLEQCLTYTNVVLW